MKCNGHLAFQYAIDCWGVHSDAGMCGAILSCNVVAPHMDSTVIIMLQKVNKLVQAKNLEF